MNNIFFHAHLKNSGENMKTKLKLLSIVFAVSFIFSFSINNRALADDSVYLGGMTAGFSLYTQGVEIIGICDVITENGLVSPLKNTGIKEGDIITKINDVDINNSNDIKNSLENDGNAIIEYISNQTNYIVKTKAAKDVNGQYKLGVYIRDCVSGIGTITYIRGNRFASLGHPVVNNEGGELKISGGNLYNCNISGCVMGIRGRAGELKGSFIRKDPIAIVDKNISCGVYGYINDNYNLSNLTKIQLGSASVGEAFIYSTINGNTPKKYSVSIVKVDDMFENKNLVVKITDKELLETTGGIIQGMSGSPIVQNNKLVGAITHVFINDPTRGFGIKINNMINN